MKYFRKFILFVVDSWRLVMDAKEAFKGWADE
jgi:hypothetical protein